MIYYKNNQADSNHWWPPPHYWNGSLKEKLRKLYSLKSSLKKLSRTKPNWVLRYVRNKVGIGNLRNMFKTYQDVGGF